MPTLSPWQSGHPCLLLGFDTLIICNCKTLTARNLRIQFAKEVIINQWKYLLTYTVDLG